MKLICAITATAILMVCLTTRSFSQDACRSQGSAWFTLENAQWQGQISSYQANQRNTSYGRQGGEGDSDAVQCLYEMHRLMRINPREDEPGDGPILMKGLLALPLLRNNNLLQLALRPQDDIYLTFAKRFMLYEMKMGPKIGSTPGAIAIDTHVHTCVSPDSLADPAEMLMAATNHGLAGIAITDHNSLEGARRATEVAQKLIAQGKLPSNFFVIQGEEISSSDGHIIGLFLKSKIEPDMSAESTVKAIHDQGGIAIAAHPLLPKSLGNLANTLPFDAVESENAAEKMHYAMEAGADRKYRAKFYAAVKKPLLGVSDAHDPQAVGECCTLLHCAATPEAVRAAILAAMSNR